MSERAEGVIEQKLPKGLYRVKTDDGKSFIASTPADTRRVTVKFIPGDRVTIEISPFDPTRGRISSKAPQ